MLYSKPIGQISYEDIRAFLGQKFRERVNLDYKEKITGKLERTICALANTYGGDIIIGVKDVDGEPNPKSKGIEFQDGLEEQITRIAIDNIMYRLLDVHRREP